VAVGSQEADIEDALIRAFKTLKADYPEIFADLSDVIVSRRVNRELVMGSVGSSLNQIAKREGRCRKQFTRLLRVGWLSPRVVEAILERRQPARLARKWLLEVELPLDWKEQEQLLCSSG
tara:strand:- start:260 stop:619 length:360 start_codon:yes stop_codon:yes gene_type:complete